MGYAAKLVPEQVIFYRIKVISNDKSWTIEHRYSEFDNLAIALKKIFMNIPILPPKSAFKGILPEELDKRKEKLNSFLKELIAMPEVLNNELVCNFLMVWKCK